MITLIPTDPTKNVIYRHTCEVQLPIGWGRWNHIVCLPLLQYFLCGRKLPYEKSFNLGKIRQERHSGWQSQVTPNFHYSCSWASYVKGVSWNAPDFLIHQLMTTESLPQAMPRRGGGTQRSLAQIPDPEFLRLINKIIYKDTKFGSTLLWKVKLGKCYQRIIVKIKRECIQCS